LSLPYLAFVEALRSYALSRDVKDLQEDLGSGAAEVARIVSEVRERLKIKLRASGDPDDRVSGECSDGAAAAAGPVLF